MYQKKYKTVCVLSAQFLDNLESNKEHKTRTIIFEYNRTKDAVDNADKLIGEYSCARRTSRWPLQLFINIINIAAQNTFII